MKKKTIIFMGPLPPPYMGPSIATQIILNSRFVDEFNIIHIDTCDPRSLNHLARIDFTNILLTIKQYLLLFIQLIMHDVDIVYIPLCQSTIGFLHDAPQIIISKLFRKKVVLHLRGGYFRKFYNSSSRFMRFIIEKTLKRVDRMIVLGNSLKPIFEGLLKENRISVVPNGLNLSLNGRRVKNSNKNHIAILFLSNFIETKGFWEVLFSIKKIISHYQNVKFVFAGSWVDEKQRLECENFIIKENLKEYTEFRNTVAGRDKIKLLKEADIFVFPTYYPMEGHPWVIVEAMAAGLPIISTDQGCIKESVVDGENGFIIPKKDPDAIVEKIKYLIMNPTLRYKMGEKSRQFFKEKFTKEHFVRKLIDAMNLTLNLTTSPKR